MRSNPVEDSAFPAPRLRHDASLASLLVQIVFVAYFILSRTDDWLIVIVYGWISKAFIKKEKTDLVLFDGGQGFLNLLCQSINSFFTEESVKRVLEKDKFCLSSKQTVRRSKPGNWAIELLAT